MLNLADEIGKVFDFFEALAKIAAWNCGLLVTSVRLRAIRDAASGVKQPAFERPALYAAREAIVVRCQTVDHQVQVSVETPVRPLRPSTYRDCLTVSTA